MTPADRIRVYIAGDIHPTRGLVRRFLEDDGYAVVGTTISRKTMMAALRKTEPDAVVVDEDLLVSGPSGGTLAKIRQAVPDAKVIVFTSTPSADVSAQPAADGYLEKGVGLAALSALLGRLFADETARIEPLAIGAGAITGVGAGTAVSGGPARERVAAATAANGNGAATTARVVAIASGAILVVWGMIAMLATGGGPAPPPLDRTEGNRDGTVVFESAMDDAYASLRGLIGAIERGDYVLASVEAQALLDARARAREQGYAITGLDADITARLDTVVDFLPLRVNTTLSSILGVLYPDLPDETVPGGGSEIVFGPVFTGGTTGSGDVVTGGDRSGDGSGSDRNGGGGGGGNGGGGGDAGPAALAPGDGHDWGQSHKPSHAGQGAPPAGGGPPPWANGNANGHDK